MAEPYYYSKKELLNTPSVADGMDPVTEKQYRKEGARFIIDLSHNLKLAHNATACAVVYFHQFYMAHSFVSFSRYVTACGCLLLAGKVEETPKKCKDLIDVSKALLPAEQFAYFGQNPKKEITTLEKILLQTIKFRIEVRNPYNFLLSYAKELKGDESVINSFVQSAWTFINDSLCSTLCLQWEPEIIAVTTMYMACFICKYKPRLKDGRDKLQKHWWDVWIGGMTSKDFESIRRDILGLYNENKQHPSSCKIDSKSSTSSNTPQPSPGQQLSVTASTRKSPSEISKKSPNPVSLKHHITAEVNGIPSNNPSPPFPKPGEPTGMALASTPGEEGHTPPGPPPVKKRRPKSPKTPPMPCPDETTVNGVVSQQDIQLQNAITSYAPTIPAAPTMIDSNAYMQMQMGYAAYPMFVQGGVPYYPQFYPAYPQQVPPTQDQQQIIPPSPHQQVHHPPPPPNMWPMQPQPGPMGATFPNNVPVRQMRPPHPQQMRHPRPGGPGGHPYNDMKMHRPGPPHPHQMQHHGRHPIRMPPFDHPPRPPPPHHLNRHPRPFWRPDNSVVNY